MQRIEALRQKAMEHKHCGDEFFYHFYRRYSENRFASEYEKYSDAMYFAFSELTPNIGEDELIVGSVKNNLTPSQNELWQSKYKDIAEQRKRLAGGGQDSHMAIDYGLILTEGIGGIVARIDGFLARSEGEPYEFYRAAKACLLAVVRHSEAYADHALGLAKQEKDPVRREELFELCRICRKVPNEPASSFYEAVQSVHFISYCLGFNPFRCGCSQQFQLGRPDRYLYPYYLKDIGSGAITKEKAQLLLDCLAVQINMRVPSGLSSGYMLGGRNSDGEVVANELTEMLMRVIDDVRLVYPAVGLCYTSDMPDKYLDLACDILSRGRSHPALFNDDVITKGLLEYGVSPSEASDYIHSTCVEITPIAASNIWVASPYTNMAQLLLDTMDREYESLEKHIEALLELLDGRIKMNFEEQDRLRKQRCEHSLNPLLSCFVNDCLARGRDIERGGARYNWIMPSFVGMANLVDSLYALKKTVYDSGEYTVRELKRILDEDFRNDETLRLRLLQSIPKYGNDLDEVDKYFGIFTEHIIAECQKYTSIHSEARLIPSVFCWVKHERFGRETGATPDGRHAGFPLGDGSGPCQGREMRGPTASIISSTKWDHHRLIGGVAVNLKFSKSTLGAASIEVMRAIVKTYMQRGGFELQINVTNREILEKARQDPDSYRDLIVRIGGYSDYFTRLSSQMQNEIILRTEHKI